MINQFDIKEVKPMRTVYIPVGVIGCGKTTYGLNLVKQDPSVVIVNRDKIREMFYGEYGYRKNFEERIKRVSYNACLEALLGGYDVYMDETNLTKEKRMALIAVIKEYYEFPVRFIAVNFGFHPQYLKRRQAENRGISPEQWEKIYNEMVALYESPDVSEGFVGINSLKTIKDDDTVVISRSFTLQSLYCKEKNLPILINELCVCATCNRCYDDIIGDFADKKHVTSCPICNRSFVD